MSQSEGMQPAWWRELPTPIGPLLLACTEAGLTNVCFQSGPRPAQPMRHWQQGLQPFVEVERQLGEYFAGRRRVFELRLAPAGTDFQLLVWRALQKIPFGRTTSYGQIARDLGLRNAARAVGLANGSNPLPIIIPCHRVIGADGSLTGFGGGLGIKRALLRLEGAECVTDLFSVRDGGPALDDTHGQATCPTRPMSR